MVYLTGAGPHQPPGVSEPAGAPWGRAWAGALENTGQQGEEQSLCERELSHEASEADAAAW